MPDKKRTSFSFKFINLPAFLVSFAFGMFAVYIYEPDQKKIMVYPSPDNVDYVQYKDQADNCFQFKQTKVQCPANKDSLPRIPIQA
jgi:hypothetical protein